MRWLGILGLAVAGLVWWGLATEGRTRGRRIAERPEESASEDPQPRLDEDAWPPPVDLSAVDRMRDLHGIVVRKRDGEPVPGARLSVHHEPWSRVQLRLLASDPVEECVATAVSSRDGTFAIPLALERNYLLRVEKEGFAKLEWRLARRGGRLRVELDEGNPLRVRVLDSNGGTADGARITVVTFDSWQRRSRYQGTTGAAGEMAWSHVRRAGGTQIEVDHPEHGFFRTSFLRDPGELEVVTYPEGRTIRGRVLDRATRQPISGARVGMGNRLDGAVAADGDGRFLIHGWTGKTRGGMLCAEAPGYALNGVQVRDAVELDIELSTGGSIIGRIVDADGAPVAGALAVLESAIPVGRDFLWQTRKSVSGADGGIEFDGIGTHPKPEITRHQLLVFADGYARVERSVTKFAERGDPLDLGEIRLESPHELRVTFVRGGEPVTRNLVGLNGPFQSPKGRVMRGRYVHATTDDLGRVRFGELAPGYYTLLVRTEGAPGARQTVELTDPVQDLVVELQTGRPLRITVVDETGSPIEHARIRAQSKGAQFYATSNEQGVATLHVPPETHEVRVEGPLERSTLFAPAGKVYAIDPAQDEVRIVHTNKIPIRGAVVLEDGRPADRPAVRAMRGGQIVGDSAGNERGEFTVYVTSGPSCRLEVYGEAPHGIGIPGGLVGTIENVAPGAEEVRIVARVDGRRSSLRVTAVGPDGRPLPGVYITNQFGKGGFADENGVVQLDDLPASSILLLGFDPQARCAHPEPVRVTPRGQKLRLQFRAGMDLGVRLMSGGEPLAGISCMLQGNAVRGSVQTDQAGWMRFALPAGSKASLRISVFTPDGQFDVRDVTAQSDGKTYDVRNR